MHFPQHNHSKTVVLVFGWGMVHFPAPAGDPGVGLRCSAVNPLVILEWDYSVVLSTPGDPGVGLRCSAVNPLVILEWDYGVVLSSPW